MQHSYLLSTALLLSAALPMSARRACNSPGTEVILNSIVGALIEEGRMPTGAMIDAGANQGEWACFYASVVRDNRTVFAMDPMEANVRRIWNRYVLKAGLRNLQPSVGILGSVDGTISRSALGKQSASQQYNNLHLLNSPTRGVRGADLGGLSVYTVDGLFQGAWRGQRLGFAHWDVEGSELDVLRGAVETIARDQPIFTVEVHVHQDQNYTTNLLQYIDWISYDAFLVEEIVGRRYDGRNLLCVPRSRRAELALSSTLDLAAAARAIFAVNANSVHEHAYPCCKPGGKCCPALGSRCCRSGDTLRWHRRQVAEWGRANSSFRGRNPLLFTHVNFFSQSRYKWSALKSG